MVSTAGEREKEEPRKTHSVELNPSIYDYPREMLEIFHLHLRASVLAQLLTTNDVQGRRIHIIIHIEGVLVHVQL